MLLPPLSLLLLSCPFVNMVFLGSFHFLFCFLVDHASPVLCLLFWLFPFWELKIVWMPLVLWQHTSLCCPSLLGVCLCLGLRLLACELGFIYVLLRFLSTWTLVFHLLPNFFFVDMPVIYFNYLVVIPLVPYYSFSFIPLNLLFNIFFPFNRLPTSISPTCCLFVLLLVLDILVCLFAFSWPPFRYCFLNHMFLLQNLSLLLNLFLYPGCYSSFLN